MELHTFSSLKKEFLSQYKNTMCNADEAIVYFNPKTIEHKKLDPISKEEVLNAFGGKNVTVYTNSDDLIKDLLNHEFISTNVLLMSSGNFSGINLDQLAKKIVSK
jgi:UDP-N-acetylmuramate: L-alanyl-gamma-D-glutamyl-meso-diaminopimelate ligase